MINFKRVDDLSKLFLVVAVFLISCSKGDRMSEIKSDQERIYVYASKDYNKVVRKFNVSLQKAKEMAREFERGFPIGDHYFLIGDNYVFSILANKIGEIECSGIYVNGISGSVKKIKTNRVFGKADKDWKTRYSVRGLKPAKE